MHSDKEKLLEQRETERLVGEAFAYVERIVRASSKQGNAERVIAIDKLYTQARELEKDNAFGEKRCMDCVYLKLFFYGKDTVQFCCGHPEEHGQDVELTSSCDRWELRNSPAIWCRDCVFFRGSIPQGKATVSYCCNALAEPGIVGRHQPACSLVRPVTPEEHVTIKKRFCQSCRWYKATEQGRGISFECTHMRGGTVKTMPQLTCSWYEWKGRSIYPTGRGAKDGREK